MQHKTYTEREILNNIESLTISLNNFISQRKEINKSISNMKKQIKFGRSWTQVSIKCFNAESEEKDNS